MVAAPLLAWLYGTTAGLAVMSLALAAACFLAVDTLRSLTSPKPPRLKALVAVNAFLCVLCLLALLQRIAAN
jgi:hypothetical protein